MLSRSQSSSLSLTLFAGGTDGHMGHSEAMKVDYATDQWGSIVYKDAELITHTAEQCQGYCVVHNPVHHHMIGWPIVWRADTRLFERMCPCGVGHPDPSQFEYWESTDQTWKMIHGCCGCCVQGDQDV